MAEVVDGVVESKGKRVERLNRDEEVFGAERRSEGKKNGGNIVFICFLKTSLLGFLIWLL